MLPLDDELLRVDELLAVAVELTVLPLDDELLVLAAEVELLVLAEEVELLEDEPVDDELPDVAEELVLPELELVEVLVLPDDVAELFALDELPFPIEDEPLEETDAELRAPVLVEPDPVVAPLPVDAVVLVDPWLETELVLSVAAPEEVALDDEAPVVAPEVGAMQMPSEPQALPAGHGVFASHW